MPRFPPLIVGICLLLALLMAPSNSALTKDKKTCAILYICDQEGMHPVVKPVEEMLAEYGVERKVMKCLYNCYRIRQTVKALGPYTCPWTDDDGKSHFCSMRGHGWDMTFSFNEGKDDCPVVKLPDCTENVKLPKGHLPKHAVPAEDGDESDDDIPPPTQTEKPEQTPEPEKTDPKQPANGEENPEGPDTTANPEDTASEGATDSALNANFNVLLPFLMAVGAGILVPLLGFLGDSIGAGAISIMANS